MSRGGSIVGTSVLIEAKDVDTDQIMPKQFCLRVDRTGYEDALFFEWRKSKDSPLNAPRARTSPFLVAGDNFGCGSSREHAVWGLLDFGFKAVIAPSFGDTFRANCGSAGLVAATISPDGLQALVDMVCHDRDTQLALDVAAQTLTIGNSADRRVIPVSIPPFHRCLHLQAATEFSLAAAQDEAISAYEARRPRWMPRMTASIAAPTHD